MPVTLLRTWGGTQRAWGYEVRADFWDGVREHNESFGFSREPTAQELADRCAAAAARLDAMLNPPVRYTITNADGSVTEIREQGDPIAVDLRITLTTAQRNAWDLVRPILKAYLARVWRYLKDLPPEKVAELRAKNVTLDRVFDLLGE